MKLYIRDPQFFRKRSTGSPLRVIDLDVEPCPVIMATGLRSVTHDRYWIEDEDVGRIVYRSDNPNGFVTGKDFSIDAPCATVMAAGMAGDSLGHWHFADSGRTDVPPKPDQSKPPYRVPAMPEIAALKPNGFRVVSTFAGCGGSSLGYRMAGFRVLWASEFVPAAQDSYRANMAPGTILDGRDIAQVTAADILRATGLKAGELDVLDGSPPCQAFSTAGRREKGWGTEREYAHGAKQKNEDLFFEYVRLVKGLRPRTFVAENVSGLVKGTAKGYFLSILAALKEPGYRVVAQLLDAQWLGVPQTRQRIIFVGVREDLDIEPAFPLPISYRYSVRDALPWINGVGGIRATGFAGSKMGQSSQPSPTIMAGGGAGMNTSQFGVEARKVANGDTVPENVAASLDGYAIGAEWDKLNPGGQSEKFFSLVRPDAGEPCPTVTSQGAGGSGTGAPGGVASVTHPTERRKFTIAELKRICAFPDDFVLKGTYAQQWERLGNSVPPLMMRAIAEALRDRVLIPAAQRAVPASGKHSTIRRGSDTSRAASRLASKGAGATPGGRSRRSTTTAPSGGT